MARPHRHGARSLRAAGDPDPAIVLPVDLDGLVALLTRSALPLRRTGGEGRPVYATTWHLADPGSGPSPDGAARGDLPVVVRSSLDRLTEALWAPGATVAGAIANVEVTDADVRVTLRPVPGALAAPVPDPLAAPVPDQLAVPVDLLHLVDRIEVPATQPGWVAQVVSGAVQAGHHHGLQVVRRPL